MIITITGKPCSGKSAVIGYIMEKYGFQRFGAGDIFRKVAADRGIDVLELNRLNDQSIDRYVDDEIVRYSTANLDKKIIFDSRTAWHFVPLSFKVFLDVDSDEQARRLMGANRTTEKSDVTVEEAKANLAERWELENNRYREIYGFDNRDTTKYDLVVNNTNLSIEETGEIIYQRYLKFVDSLK